MKSFNKVLGTIKRRPTFGGGSSEEATATVDPSTETPETTAVRCVKGFCESGGDHSGNDVTYLPYIVDAAESSPAAAAEAARFIRKFLYRDYWSKPTFQYNAIMLIRILADNPGPTFTRNLDKKFVDATKELLRSGRDASVRQMLMETLDTFENTKGYDEGLRPLIDMWKKEKEKAYKAYGGRPAPVPRTLNAPAFDSPQPAQQPHQSYFARSHTNMRLPNPVELANRLEEARTSAKLLEQVVTCTAPSEMLSNDLIKEFADRCLSASRSIQGYMSATNPAPDNDTMESLLDTNEQLQSSLNLHQRAVLNAKKQLGLGEHSSQESGLPLPPAREQAGWGGPAASGSSSGGAWQQPSSASASSSRHNLGAPPPVPSRQAVGNGKGKASATWEPSVAGPSRSATGTPQYQHEDEDDPFRDPQPEASGSAYRPSGPSGSGAGADSGGASSTYAYEPYHPGTRHGAPQLDPVTPVSDDGFDLYSATPGKKSEAVYRY
ncbi:hypothetical protein V8F06_007948 [Rhypophila decipiens]